MKLACKRAFSLIEMLVVVTIVSILAAMLMPSLQSALGSARVSVCTNNARQLNFGFAAYATDFQDYRPVNYLDPIGKSWANGFISLKYITGKDIFRCPEYADFDLANRSNSKLSVDDNYIGVGINMNRFWSGLYTSASYKQYLPNLRIPDERTPSKLALTSESNNYFYVRDYNYSSNKNAGDLPATRHASGSGILLFADGHAQLILALDQTSAYLIPFTRR